MPSYEELKTELEQISKLVEKFPEAIKPNVYDLLVSTFLGVKQPSKIDNPEVISRKPKRKIKSAQAEVAASGKSQPEKSTSRKTGTKESYQIDRELNLRGDKSIPSFKAFCAEKNPSSVGEFNAVAVYYLQKILGLSGITLNQTYTCYSEADRRPPEAFRQSFIDAKNKKGWVEFDESGNLRIPHRGAVFVEHDLPRPAKGKK